MIKPKDNTNLKTIISITKEETNNNNKSTTNDISKIKSNEKQNQDKTKSHLNNLNLKENNKNNEEQVKNLEENNDEENDEKKYFEFNAHFKYQELVDALNVLISKKNESTSNTSNANINNNINNKNKNEKDNKNDNCNNTNNDNNSISNINKPYNYKGISRNIQMNNYIKYLEYIEEDKDKNLMPPARAWLQTTRGLCLYKNHVSYSFFL